MVPDTQKINRIVEDAIEKHVKRREEILSKLGRMVVDNYLNTIDPLNYKKAIVERVLVKHKIRIFRLDGVINALMDVKKELEAETVTPAPSVPVTVNNIGIGDIVEITSTTKLPSGLNVGDICMVMAFFKFNTKVIQARTRAGEYFTVDLQDVTRVGDNQWYPPHENEIGSA